MNMNALEVKKFIFIPTIILGPHCQVPPSFPLLAVLKSGRGPGIIYHMSDVEGREKVERTSLSVSQCAHTCSCAINNTHNRVLVGANSGSYFEQ